MLKKILMIISLFLGITVGTLATSALLNYNVFPAINETSLRLIGITGTAVIFLLVSLLFSDRFIEAMRRIEDRLSKTPIQKIVFTTIGLILGLLLAMLLSAGVDVIAGAGIMGRIISAIIYIVFGYLGLVLGYRRGGEFLNIFTSFKLGNRNKERETKSKNKKITEILAKIIDTSALIDSRIHDVAKTGFLEGKVIVPEFVLKELQLISDSEDPLKRSKGRLGLDCVEDLQKMKEIDLEIDNKYSYNEHKGVDNLLIDYALKYKCAIITTDYNLNKLATLQSIKVLNVNDLSNAVKPILTTGEKLKVQVLREGKENNQGVAYTEDGTMIVVENGKRHVGKSIEVEVQSVLQTSSGRIIFTKIV
ncbi:PIN/TRAM domain-containing protein [Gemella cuniculi]|uniref:PIN/TRAM domain-containing protein n=1 Tax=Gemella cuniculi TaxID=150240 RepID=UPI0004299105|nr:TRAM domain-containing protein [Gemella cuniculi]